MEPLEIHTTVNRGIERADINAINPLIAENCRIASSPDAAGSQGKSIVLDKIQELIGKVSGSIDHFDEVRVMRCTNETRCLFVVKKGFATVTIGLLLRTSLGLVNYIVIQKGPSSTFYDDNTEPPSSSEEVEDEEKKAEDSPSSTDQGGEGVLEPPYLVPKPEVFSPPTVHVTVLSCANLKSIARIPRPLNPYVRVSMNVHPVGGDTKLKVGSSFETNTLKKEKNPTFSEENQPFIFSIPPNQRNEVSLECEIMDWNVGVDTRLSSISVPLQAVPLSSSQEGELFTFPVALNESRFSNTPSSSDTDSSITLRISHFDAEKMWEASEWKRRDEVEEERRRKEEEEKQSSTSEEPSAPSSQESKEQGGSNTGKDNCVIS
jgi:hypothetical protein